MTEETKTPLEGGELEQLYRELRAVPGTTEWRSPTHLIAPATLHALLETLTASQARQRELETERDEWKVERGVILADNTFAWATANAAETRQRELEEALRELRSLVPDAMRMLLYRGRDELLLADRIHRLDTKARVLLNSPAGEQPEGWRPVIQEIAAERRRQVEAEGWTPGHDDEHGDETLALAAACYALPADRRRHRPIPHHYEHNGRAQAGDAEWYPAGGMIHAPVDWPWDGRWWKPDHQNRRRDLIRAAALLVAEIERLDRAAPSPTGGER